MYKAITVHYGKYRVVKERVGGIPNSILGILQNISLEELTFSLRPKALVKLAWQSFERRIQKLQAEGRASLGWRDACKLKEPKEIGCGEHSEPCGWLSLE